MLANYRAAPPAVLKAAYMAKSNGGWLRTPSGRACEEVMIERGFLQNEEAEILSPAEFARLAGQSVEGVVIEAPPTFKES
jgi:cytochrome oxidase assembly protein ShyY1